MDDTLIYKYKPLNENALAILINRELYFASPASFNDPFDSQLNTFAGILELLNGDEDIRARLTEPSIRRLCEQADASVPKTGVLSLSPMDDEILMWSHYAAFHTGLCLGFSRAGLDPDFRTDRHPYYCEVVYDQVNPFAALLAEYQDGIFQPDRFFQADIYRLLHEFKHTHWQYEQEVRFLSERVGGRAFDPAHLREVIFGVRMPAAGKKLVANLLAGAEDYAHVQQYQMKREVGQFRIYKEPVTAVDFEQDGDGRGENLRAIKKP